MQNAHLKKYLDDLYSEYKHKFSSKDPVWTLHRFSDEKDIETIGLITAAYAYGSVDQINRFIIEFLTRISNKPYEFTTNFSKRKDKKFLKDMYYRFNSHDDLSDLIGSIGNVQNEYGSLKNLFLSGYNAGHENIIPALIKFSGELNVNMNRRTTGYHHYLISNPENKSTCKRMNLFLRWMVRKDEIDFGIWNEVDKSKLIMPVDVHIGRISKHLKLVKRKSIDLKFALELTTKLKEFDSTDPVKFDFALCHAGIEKRKLIV